MKSIMYCTMKLCPMIKSEQNLHNRIVCAVYPNMKLCQIIKSEAKYRLNWLQNMSKLGNNV